MTDYRMPVELVELGGHTLYVTTEDAGLIEHELNLWGSHPKAAEEVFEMFKEDAYTQDEVDAIAGAVAGLGDAAVRVKDLLDRRGPTREAVTNPKRSWDLDDITREDKI